MKLNRLKKIKNTFMQFHFLWPIVISDSHYKIIEDGKVPSILHRILIKLLWFWPQIYSARDWIVEKPDPTPFTTIDDIAITLNNYVRDAASDSNTSILDFCCNCGRQLHLLRNENFTNLFGVDINAVALNSAKDFFPNLAEGVSLMRSSAQRFLVSTNDKEFDIFFTRGATVEIIHPSFPLVKEICRITKHVAILCINENHQYPRFWVYEFARNGFSLQTKKEIERHHTIFVFKRSN